jgi:hypothetical protein
MFLDCFLVVWKLLFSKGYCNCLNVVYLRIFVLLLKCCFCTVNLQVRSPRCFFNNYIYIYIIIYCKYCFFFKFYYYSLSAGVMLCMFMLVFEFCYSALVYVILWEYVLFTESLFYSLNVVILGILLFLERLCYFLNVCGIVKCFCCCYTVNVFFSVYLRLSRNNYIIH